MVRVRFAPSPTGYIHIGNARIALFNWLYSLTNKGQYILRFDDTDIERSKQEYIDGIGQDLDWLGITPDEIWYQSKRFDVYDAAVEKLKAAGLLYACYETAEELDRRRKILLSRKLPPIYERDALKLTDAEKQAFEQEGRKPHWRFLLPNFASSPFERQRSEVRWNDIVRGPQVIDLSSMSDPVLVREDGTYLYTLPSVVDDIEMKISHIIRGDDHVTNTGVQIAIFEALGGDVPNFGHINLLTTASGEGLSKRKGDLSLRSLREDGLEPMAISSLATLTGTAENVISCFDMNELASHFNLQSVSKSSAKFDPADLNALNMQIVHKYSYDDVKDRLAKLGINGDKAEDFWNVVHENLTKVCDATHWWDIANNSDLTFAEPEEKEFLSEAAKLLPESPWDKTTWKNWTVAIKDKTGRKGKDLFHPLRVALTGEQSGPELASFLLLLDRDLVLKRLTA
ncbi:MULTISPECIES: glutamate--tRNA ligase [unclassified Bartonella]|uniref:glutamate--tRNA ligase n=1 Tax=unclassified Bartonella TaxID=2645622 RepID=UPI0021C73039|nr:MULTISPECIES: glutamate--tRNA ligase [unclassified Bartonella]UXN04046.1 glutamate--tRNA ligase [Bartonella sp. HY406]UXN07033.1 glutamate--tRNA ligase [Bartonella sp. HY761]